MTSNSSSGSFVPTVLVALVSTAAFAWALRKLKPKKDGENDEYGSNNAAVKPVSTFAEAAEVGRELGNLMPGEQLVLYALYKQVTVGDAPMDDPPSSSFLMNVVEQYKFEAWQKLRGMSEEEASAKYILAVNTFLLGQEYDDDHENDHLTLEDMVGASDEVGIGGLGGKRQSLPQEEVEDDQDSGQNPLFLAASSNDVKTIQMLLDQEDTVVDSRDDSGQTALHLAVDRGSMEAFKMLLHAGADPSAVDGDGVSVLQTAVIADNLEACKMLLSMGADPDKSDQDGDTPRSCAQEDGSDEIKELFHSMIEYDGYVLAAKAIQQ